MACRRYFKSEESFQKYKQAEYARYYGSTQLYAPRIWSDEEIDFLIKNYDMVARSLSAELKRSVKSIEHKKKFLRTKGLVHKTEDNITKEDVLCQDTGLVGEATQI